ncbi:MAG: glycosyltransferase family 4 protein [Betaproteobacteria bacterium]|nr:glycosyltransferase family 4 protein [Betaproteobacteria bacterium]
MIDRVHISGLIQSYDHVLARGLPADGTEGAAIPAHEKINRLSQVAITLRQDSNRPDLDVFNPGRHGRRMLLRWLIGMREELSRFDATHFEDFIWRNLFARTLHADDFNTVVKAEFRIARVPWKSVQYHALLTHKLGFVMYPKLDTSDFDFMIAETPYPGIVSPNTHLIVRYHDAIPLLMPHTIANKVIHQATHYHALRSNVKHGAFFACVSEATRRDLISIFPEVAARSITIHNMVSHHYHPEDSSPARVPEIVRTRLNDGIKATGKETAGINVENSKNVQPFDYLLIVSTIEPRKNHTTLLAAWEHLRADQYPNLKLVVVGMLGWDHEPILKKLRPWIEREQLFVLEDVPSPELRVLYKHALATVCPSYGEGFDYSGVEAMRCGGAVVASDIPVHHEIYGDAAEFFSPYSTAELVTAIDAVISPNAHPRRSELIAKGAVVSSQYLPEKILPQWQDMLQTRLNLHV